jgi:ABC-type lipoprotein release transport system permease subunit
VTGLWLRTELRRRWRSVVVLGILAGLTSGLAIAAVDGARRSGTAIDHNAEVTRQPDVMVLPSRFGFDWTKISKLPQVAAIGLFGVTQQMGAIDVQPAGALSTFPAANRAIGDTVDRPRISAGRAVDPSNPHEVVVTAAAAKLLHLRIGQQFTVSGDSPAQAADLFGGDHEPAGPKVRVRIVGIVGHDSLWGRYLGSSDRVDDPTMVGFLTSPALVEKYAFGYAPNALVRLRHGAADVAGFRAGVARVTGDPTIPVRDLSADRARFERAISVEQTALVMFAIAVAAAGIVLLGQALVRLVQASTEDAWAVNALGATRGQVTVAAAAPAVLVAATAMVVAVAMAFAVSPRFPIGISRSVEVDLGAHLDPLVTVIGLAVVAALVAVGALGASYRLLASARTAERPPLVGRVIARLHLPVPTELGTRMALHRGRGRSAVPVRPALVAAAAGVIGIVGAFTFRAGLDDAVGNAALAGTTWQRVVYVDPGKPVHALPSLEGTPGLRAAALVDRSGVNLEGDTVSAWSYRPLVGELRRVIVDGRAPTGPDETALGVGTADAIGKGVGDPVTVNGRRLRIVGTGFLPEQEGHSAYDEGLWVTPVTFARLREKEIDDREILADFRGVRIHTPPTVADLTGNTPSSRALSRALGDDALFVEAASAPSAMSNLSSVRGLPLALGVFLVLLGIGALAHALVSSVARRRGDLAVMRAIGTTPRQVRSMVAVHATVVGIVGLAVGVPLGVIVGQVGWRWVASSMPFLYVGPLAALALALAVPVALVVANVVAAWPARTAARLRPAEILRSE